MATYSLISMGAVLNDPCRPANVCRGPVELKNGDLYYDSNWPNKILSFNGSYSNPTEFATLQNGDIIINDTSGLKYHYSLTDGVVFDTFAWPDHTYIILGEISGTITIPANCTLIFEGGKFAGSLTGDNTTIDASPVQIFDEDITLDGTFTNECAYPEWWGAKATKTRDSNHDTLLDCYPAIQAAFDSPFYKIEFATGFYLVESTLLMRKRKHILMQGMGICGFRDRYRWDPVQGTVLWARQDITVVMIMLDNDIYAPSYNDAPTKVDGKARLIWEGGCIDVSYMRFVGTYHHPAMDYRPRVEQNTQLKLALRGPMESYDNTSTEITPVFNNIGLQISNPFVINQQGGIVLTYGGLTASVLDLDIFGFDTGIGVNFKKHDVNGTDLGALTSISVHGFIARCFQYISAPHGGFNGAVIDCHIQTGYQNRVLASGTPPFPIYLLDGDFSECYIDSRIWDYPYYYALRTTNTDRMRLGPRMLTVLVNNLYSMMMTPQNVAGMIDNADGLHNASIGHYDLQQLGSFNGMTSARNYMHLIDNDLLSYDKIWGQEDIPGREIVVTTNNLPGVVVRNKSPFDREGFRIYFTKDNGNVPENGSLTVSIPMPYTEGFEENRVRLLFLAIHLKSSHYTYFNNLRVTVTNIDNTSMELFDGPYVDVHTNFNDIVLPLLWNTNESVRPSVLVFEFTDLAKVSPIWERYGVGAYSDTFKFSVEGRFNIHSHNNIWSASGGDMGKDILRLGQPYLLGSKKYPTFSDLPSNASPGAIGLLANTYPVVKTPNGWMIQNLVGRTSDLISLQSAVGGFSVGQSAFNISLGKPMWWNGTVWVDASGNAV